MNGRTDRAQSVFLFNILATLLVLSSLPASGQELELDVEVLLEGERLGAIPIQIDEESGELLRVNRAVFSLLEPIAELPAVESAWIAPEHFEQAGIELEFDVNRVQLQLGIPPELRHTREHDASGGGGNATVTAKPEAVSGGLNLFSRTSLARETEAEGAGTELNLRAQPFLNVRDWVAEADMQLATDEEQLFTVDQYRVLHDFEGPAIRLQAGTLSYPTIAEQGRRDLLGLAVERNLALDPDIARERDTVEFFLEQAGDVTVYLNDRRIYSDELTPGPHRLRGVNLSRGRNALRLVVDDEERELAVPHDSGLLPEGVFDFAAASGVPRDDPDYPLSWPAFGGFLRYGLAPQWSGGLYTHLDSGTQMMGLESVAAATWGAVTSSVSASRSDFSEAEELSGARFGLSGSLAYHFMVPSTLTPTVTVSAGSRTRHFSSAGMPSNPQRYAADSGVSLGVPLGDRARIGLGLRGRFGFNTDHTSVTARMSGSLDMGESTRLRAGMNIDNVGTADASFGGSLSFTMRPSAGRHTVRFQQSVDSMETSVSLAGNAATERGELRWDSSAGYRPLREREHRWDGTTRYNGSRGRVGLRSSVELSDQHAEPFYDIEASLDSAVLFAGSTFAVSRPAQSSFVLIDKHPTIGEAAVGVRRGSEWRARSDWLGPAAVTGFGSYRQQRVSLDAEEVPDDVGLGTMSHTLLPRYRSGYALTVGIGAVVHLRARLLDGAGEPVSLAGGTARPAGDGSGEPASVRFFTDESGVLEIYELRPGRWELALSGGRRAEIEIPGEARGTYELGDIELEESDEVE